MIYNVGFSRNEKGYKALLQHLQESRSQVSEYQTHNDGKCYVNLHTNRWNHKRQTTKMTNDEIVENAKKNGLRVS